MDNSNKSTSHASVQAILAAGGRKPLTLKGKKPIILLLAALMVMGVGYYFFAKPTSDSQASFKTTAVKSGKLSVTVTATGNLQPKNKVDIGTELSGTVDEVLVDANDAVKKGQVLARLNTTQLKDTITKSKASLAGAEAKVKQAAATVKEARANLNRLRQLYAASGGKLPARADLDAATATLERAQADQDVSKATVTSAKAELRSTETNLGKAIITSPIDGVVLSRAVEPGQTVASSLSAPTLFTLAEDLAQMEAEVGVDEADVGKVKAGQKAEFTVDAWSGRKYPAEITRVSLSADTSENVISYLTVLAVQNTDLSLRPGMTATATILTDTHDNALLIPNTALRFTPPVTDTTAGANPAANANSSFLSKLMPRPPMGGQRKRSNGNGSGKPNGDTQGMQKVWVLENGTPTSVMIKTGLSDGKMTEVTEGKLQAGMPVITESTAAGGKP